MSLISKNGNQVFYKGPIPKSIVAASKAHSGFLLMADFTHYTAPGGAPITCGYAEYTVRGVHLAAELGRDDDLLETWVF